MNQIEIPKIKDFMGDLVKKFIVDILNDTILILSEGKKVEKHFYV